MRHSQNPKNYPNVAQGNDHYVQGNSFSFSVGPRLDPRLRKDGTCAIFLQVIVNRKRRKIPMDIRVKPSEWDKKNKLVKKSHALSGEYNMILRQAISQANDVAVRHRLTGQLLTADLVKHSYGHYSFRGGDFLRFMQSEIEERVGVLKKRTLDHHRCTLAKLRDCFPDGLGFNEVCEDTVNEFVKFLHIQGLGPNTRTSNLKRWKVYVARAQKRSYIQGNPFSEVKMKFYPSDRESLTIEERDAFIQLYQSPFVSTSMRQTLQCFLFSTYTGIRIGDLNQVSRKNIVNGELVLMPGKTEVFVKTVRIPLEDSATSYLNKQDPQWRFQKPSEKTMNELLKEAAKICAIPKRISYHFSRHTFATLFLESGGDVEVLQELLGHSEIKTTMVYVHITDKRKREQIKNMGAKPNT